MEFVQEERPNVYKELGSSISVGDAGKELGRRWRALSQDQRSKFEERSKAKWKSYKEELQKLDKNGMEMPKKPLSPYFEFVKEERDRVKAELGSLSIVEIGKELGRRWRSLSVEQKRVFQDRTKVGQIQYDSEMREFMLKIAEDAASVEKVLENDECSNVSEDVPLSSNINSTEVFRLHLLGPVMNLLLLLPT